MVTMSQLTSWNPAALSTAADQLLTIKKAFVDLQDEIDGGRPPTSWKGDDADAATKRHSVLRDDLNDLAAPLAQIIAALDAAETEISGAKEDLLSATSHAQGQGWVVEEKGGTVTVTDPSPPDDADSSFFSELVDRSRLTASATAITAALDRASGADGDLTAVLNAAKAGSYDGFSGSVTAATKVMGPTDATRRQGQVDAFDDYFGRVPTTPTDWSMAAMLDAQSHQSKNGDADAVLKVGQITPRPGMGLVRIGLYIPSAEVFNVPHYDRGDDRGPDEKFDPEQARVTMYVDYETGTVIARQNPSVDTEGEVRVDSPEVRVSETTNGSVRIEYDASNPFAPPDPTNSHRVHGDVVVSPDASGKSVRLDGTIGDYPAFEAYHDAPDGSTSVVAQDAADNEGSFGPLIELPQNHDVGGGPDSDEVKQFGVLGRPITGNIYEYSPPPPGAELGSVDDPTKVDPHLPFGKEPAGAMV